MRGMDSTDWLKEKQPGTFQGGGERQTELDRREGQALLGGIKKTDIILSDWDTLWKLGTEGER